MKTDTRLNRRAFLASSAQAAAAFSLAGSALFAGPPAPRSFIVRAKQARGIAINSEGILAVAADNAILFFDLDGRLQRETATARPVRAVCFDAAGRLFATFADQVARLDASGELVMLGESCGRESALTGLAIADGGEIYAADSGNRLVWRMDAAGRVLGAIKPAEGVFAVPRAFFPIAWRNGRLVVADPGRHQIQTYSPEGELVAKWGGRSRDAGGFGGCCNPVSFVALADGTIVTAERGQPRVKAFDAGGRMTRMLAGPEQFAAGAEAAGPGKDELFGCEGGLFDLAASPRGEVVVLDRTTREIRVLA